MPRSVFVRIVRLLSPSVVLGASLLLSGCLGIPGV